MKNLALLAIEGNADELFATIESDHYESPILLQFNNLYENAQIDDKEFCDKVKAYFAPPPSLVKKFVVVMTNRDNWDEPLVYIVEAHSINSAEDLGIEKSGFNQKEIDEMLEEGTIQIIIKEIK